MIGRATIYADSTWSVGPVGATITGDVSCETISADARKGSESDSLSVNLPLAVANFCLPPPICRRCDIIADGAILATGLIDSILITGDGVRLTVLL